MLYVHSRRIYPPVCSLDLMHQLMDTPDLEWQPGESQDPEPSWGIPLPKDIRVTNISLRVDPEQSPSSGERKPRRAVVLVYSPDSSTAECDYLVFRLQVFRNNIPTSHSSEAYVARRPFYVMAQKTIQERIIHKSWLGPVTSIFIAGAYFQFDLRKLTKTKSEVKIQKTDFVVTLGVTRTPGGIDAVSVFENGETCVGSLSNAEVARYQLSDHVASSVLSGASQEPVLIHVWSIELINGDIICWSVPSVDAAQQKRNQIEMLGADSPFQENFQEEIKSKLSYTKLPKGLSRPYLVCDRSVLSKNERWTLGTICEVGNVSDWAMQSTFGCQFDISLGQVPQSMFGCIMRCGQNSLKFARSHLRDIDPRIFSSNSIEINTYSQSPFTITPPAFVISLYTLLLEGASIQMDLKSQKPFSRGKEMKNGLKVRTLGYLIFATIYYARSNLTTTFYFETIYALQR